MLWLKLCAADNTAAKNPEAYVALETLAACFLHRVKLAETVGSLAGPSTALEELLCLDDTADLPALGSPARVAVS